MTFSSSVGGCPRQVKFCYCPWCWEESLSGSSSSLLPVSGVVVALLHVQPLCCPLPLLFPGSRGLVWQKRTGPPGIKVGARGTQWLQNEFKEKLLFHVKICFLSFIYNQELTFTKSVNPWERSVKYTYTVRVYKHVVQGCVLAYKLNSKLSK